ATDLDVALVDFKLINPQNNIYNIHYRQTTFGTGQFLPPVVVASVPGLNPDSIDFAMTAGGIPHIVFSNPGTQQVIARQFDPKASAWTTRILDTVAGPTPFNSIVAQGGMVAATWATANPNDPNASALDLRVALKEGSGNWQVNTVCTACVGNPEQLDITFSPDGFPVIAYVSPTNQLMVAFDPPAVGLIGDYNGDGIVDAADYAVWRKNDGTQDGYNVWRTNFGRTTGAGPLSDGTVPEPTTWILLLPLVILASWNRYPSNRERS
ncbi:MAG TPA: hypothetical protein VHK01_20275, partial [Lacipirellulaceae bacterium]|nr:hypothetical protein [Lacipirellulaceae bacterium]